METRDELGFQSEQMLSYEDELRPINDLVEYVREYARERPEVVAIACFAAGFILGWKLKPW